MDKNLPSKEIWQEDDLQLPDQETAWNNMKHKLEEEERKKRILPPYFLNCAGWTALLAIVFFIVWFLFIPEQQQENKKDSVGNVTEQKRNQDLKSPVPFSKHPGQKTTQDRVAYDNHPVDSGTKYQGKNNIVDTKKSKALNDDSRDGIVLKQKKAIKKFPSSMVSGRVADQPQKNKNRFTKYRNQHPFANPKTETETVDDDMADSTGSIKIPGGSKIKKGDSLKTVRADYLHEIPEISVTNFSDALASFIVPREKVKSSIKDLKFSAGIGVQQQVPFSGQTAVPYNYYGRKGSLSDYIPSVFLKMEKQDQWFIMGEFRFGAPQSLKEFSYSRKTFFDTLSGHYVETTMDLKKTYYHQLPLSFNYFVKPDLSVGIGGIYNRFYGAITEVETRTVNLITQTESLTKKIDRVQQFTDSFLYKTQLHVLLQADYQWKRLGVGIRFTKDIQPYIRYTRPDGHINEKKNQTLQVTLRYELWKQVRR